MKSRGVLGYLLLGLAFLFCPCHLVITLPLLGLWIGGTTGANFLIENQGLAFGVSAALFLISLAAGWRVMSSGSSGPACDLDARDVRKESKYEPQEQR